jgi:hypothetical protein|tara:strand:+ start:449 stop:1072 length:624 start_codon:yes stop_codon:yes gene_type:complete
MSQFDRDMNVLNNRRIVYIREPITDTPSEIYDWGSYYEEGTFEYYALFKSKAKINTYKSLKWHLLVLWYLNPQLDQDDLESLAESICYKENGFVTFKVSDQLLKSIIYDVSMCDLEVPPVNKSRKIIFNWNSMLSTEEKLSIVGTMIGRSKKINSDDIYSVMLQLHDDNKKITIGRVSALLNVSQRTIHRNMCNELKKEKELLNQQL